MPGEPIIFGRNSRFSVIFFHSRKLLTMPQMMHHKAENLMQILHALPTSYPQLLGSTKLNSTTNTVERLLRNPCALGKTSAIVFGKRPLVNRIFVQERFPHEQATIGCKSAGYFIPYVISTQCLAYLGSVISHGAGTRHYTWRNASLSSRRKPDQEGFFFLGIGAASHITQFFTLLRAERALFSLPLPHPSARKRVWREFQYWCVFFYLCSFFLCDTKSILKGSKGDLLCWMSGLQLTQIL